MSIFYLDARHLASALYLGQTVGEPPTLIASDAALLGAAAAEGLAVLDPTTASSLPPIP